MIPFEFACEQLLGEPGVWIADLRIPCIRLELARLRIHTDSPAGVEATLARLVPALVASPDLAFHAMHHAPRTQLN